MATVVALNTPLAEQLSSVVQPKLAEVGWAVGGPDDTALAEYIILMLANGKTEEQIASELSNDLLSLGPDDPGATDFARWLFQQVESLSKSTGSGFLTDVTEVAQDSGHPPIFGTGQSNQGDANGEYAENDMDAEMGDAGDGPASRNIPTGPKSMRNGAGSVRRTNPRMMGQINKAMDRSKDSLLHRIRPKGNERINMHNRQPPRGPRNDLSRNRNQSAGASNGANGPSATRASGGMLPTITPQQQMQLLQFYEQQAKMMSELFSPQQQGMLPQFPKAAVNQSFRPVGPHQGKPLSERMGKGGFQNRSSRPFRQDGQAQTSNMNGETEMGDAADAQSSMDVDSTQGNKAEETICKFNLNCTKPDCPFAHQSPVAPPGTTFDVHDVCAFGAACQNRKCSARHPSPAQRAEHKAQVDCKFFPNCTNPSCPFRHPEMPLCRFGSSCTKPDCKFTHVETKCKYNPCLNPKCPYKHEEGQKRAPVWKAPGSDSDQHVSERKYVVEEGREEELIIPGRQDENTATEIIT